MSKLFRSVMLFILILSAAFPMTAYAADNWKEAAYINEWYEARYDLSVPSYFSGNHKDWKMYYQYSSDPSDPYAMLLNWKLVDADGNAPEIDPYEFHMIYLPYPQGHDAAMGYEYVITSQDSNQAIDREHVDQAIAFRPIEGHNAGCYRLSWENKMNPKAAAWELIMSRMDWNGASCSYTVGAGSKKVKVTRQGRDITFSGGEISSVVRFANKSMWDDDYEAQQGWHTESGSYTFHNVTLLDDIYVWAHQGEDYTITLDASVKGHYCMICELHNGANLTLINNDIIQSDNWYSMNIDAHPDCSMTITGNGKILPGRGEYWSEEEQRDVLDYAPISFSIKGAGHDNKTALASIKEFEGNVVVSYDQVKVSSGYPQIRSSCWYNPDPSDPYLGEDIIDPSTGKPYSMDVSYIVKKLRPAKGAMTEPILTSTTELSEGALHRPLLIATENDQFYLRSEITEEVGNSSIEYEIHLVDADDEQVALSKTSRLYIPYPDGLDMESAANYEVTIHHAASDGDEVYSTTDGTIELTSYGFCISVSSLSPFEVSWRSPEAAVDLPETGDHSHPELHIIMLVLSLSAIVVLSRKTKRA